MTPEGGFSIAPGPLPPFVLQNSTTPGLTRWEQWLTRHFVCKLWTGGVGCPTLRRWTLLDTRWGNLYLHRFVGDDWSLDMHDHSSRMVSIGLRGRYLEETPTGSRVWTAPWCRTFPATWVHRVRLLTPTVWTIVWGWPKQQHSGFWRDGVRWGVSEYMKTWALKRKSC